MPGLCMARLRPSCNVCMTRGQVHSLWTGCDAEVAGQSGRAHHDACPLTGSHSCRHLSPHRILYHMASLECWSAPEPTIPARAGSC